MKFLIIFALAFATVWAKDLYHRSIEVPVLENEGRIANGKKATPHQFYYLAGINTYKVAKVYIWCGGSLIGQSWILTAANCIDDAVLSNVYLGAFQRFDAQKEYTVKGEDIILHPYFSRRTTSNDIGLLRIPETNETSRIGIIYIPKDNDELYINEDVAIAGWGYTSQNSKEFSNDLRYALLKVSPAINCQIAYPLYFDAYEKICVATPRKESSCGGDAGGPLVLFGQKLQIGVLSHGSGKGCEQREPIVFTRVSAYLPWIKNVTKIV